MRPSMIAGIVFAAVLAGAPHAEPQQTPPSAPCDSELNAAIGDVEGLSNRLERQVGQRVRKAVTLYRFHRPEDALARLDALLEEVNGAWRVRVDEKPRRRVMAAVQSLRSCLAATPAPELASLTVRTFQEDERTADFRGNAATGGAFVKVDDHPVGRTGADGTLTVKVPSGSVAVTVIEYPSSYGADAVTLTAGEAGTVDIVLVGSKEPSEDTDLVLAEALDDILPLGGNTLTLAFVDDGTPVAVETIEGVVLNDAQGNVIEDLTALFKVAGGSIAAVDPSAVYQRIAARARPRPAMQILAHAIDTEGRTHDGVVSFHAGQSKLSVSLAAPPSNPALNVANVPVRVSVPGTDVAIMRVSDAEGRFEVHSLPETTLAFDASIKADDRYYYTHGTMTHAGDCSVTLFLLHVSDLVNGVRDLVRDASCPTPSPLPRK